ncbi:MAG TPA: TusE/DsrC/DsvC family sulfur relay protein [Acidimicrobiia bacterium]|jgi:tRNA 2-thiouridine synthesizing protein E|nr:TusE/DsrC/DsvC family sulfur relay protein [Acidimicrobiia bacterium]
MPTTTIADREVTVDEEGFMTVYDEWDEDLGAALASQIGIEMTEDHWRAVKFLREDFAAEGATPTIRRVSTVGGIPTKELFMLFPKKPAKKMAYVAGLPKPAGCV